VSTANINACIDQVSNGASRDLYSLVNLFSGGARLQLAVFALGHHAVHHGEHHRAAAGGRDPAVRAAEEGRASRVQAKLTQYTAYLTSALAVLQSDRHHRAGSLRSLFPGPEHRGHPDDSLFRILVLVVHDDRRHRR
jgi:preprotein translocase subunit SecY